MSHARLAPSAFTRWSVCPGSVELCKDLPDESSEFAAEGTVAHKIREICLVTGMSPWDFVGRTFKQEGYSFEIDKSWPRYMEPGLDRIEDLLDEFSGTLYLEHKVNLKRWMPDQFGTLDVGIVSKNLIVINDLKWGRGVEVDSFENEQALIYGLGFWDNIARHETDAEDFLLIIDQPRLEGGGGEYRTTLRKMLKFGERLTRLAKRTYDPDAELNPGLVQCRFCPAAQNNKCPAFTKFNMDLAGLVADELGIEFKTPPKLKNKNQLTSKQKTYIALHAPLFRKWLDSIHAETLGDALAGRPTPGLKAVEGRAGARKWLNEKRAKKELLKILGADAYVRKLKSPAQAEEDLTKTEYEAMRDNVGSEKGKPILVSEDSNKKKLPPLADEFDDLTIGE